MAGSDQIVLTQGATIVSVDIAYAATTDTQVSQAFVAGTPTLILPRLCKSIKVRAFDSVPSQN